MAVIAASTTFTVEVTDAVGCVNMDTLQLDFLQTYETALLEDWNRPLLNEPNGNGLGCS